MTSMEKDMACQVGVEELEWPEQSLKPYWSFLGWTGMMTYPTSVLALTNAVVVEWANPYSPISSRKNPQKCGSNNSKGAQKYTWLWVSTTFSHIEHLELSWVLECYWPLSRTQPTSYSTVLQYLTLGKGFEVYHFVAQHLKGSYMPKGP